MRIILMALSLWKRTPILIEFQGGVQLQPGWGSLALGGVHFLAPGFKLCKPGTQKRKFSKYIQLDVDRLGEVCYDIPHIRPIVPCRLQRSGALCESLNILRANYYKSSCMGVRKWRPP